MSRTINPDKMSKFDRQYLRDRNIDPEDYAERFTLTEEDEVEELEPEEGREPARVGQAGGPEADEEGGDEEDVPYSEWDIADLKTELKNRGLPYGGREKGPLIARLEENDAENEEQVGTTADDDGEPDDESDAQPANPPAREQGTLNRDAD